MAADRLLGLCHHSHYRVIVFHQSFQGLHGKLRCPHEYDYYILFFHLTFNNRVYDNFLNTVLTRIKFTGTAMQ